MGVSHFQCSGQWNFQMREITTEIWVQEHEKPQEVGNWTLSEFLTSLIMNTAKVFSFYSKFRVICSVTITKSHTATAVAAKSLQSCLTLCDPIDGSPLGSSVPGILQARALEWGAIAIGGIILPATPLYLSLSTLQLSETKQYRRDSRGQPHGVLEWFSSLLALLPPCQFPSPLDEWGRGNITILPISKRGNS